MLTTKMKLKNKMLAGYAAPLAIYLVIATLVYSTANQVFSAFEKVKEVQNVLNQINQMALGGQGMIRSLRGYMVDPNKEFIAQYQMSYKLASNVPKSVEQVIEQEEQKQRINRMLELVSEYNEYAQNVFSLSNQGKRNEALALFRTGAGSKFVKDFDDVFKDFERVQRDLVNQKTAQASDALRLLILSVVLGSLLLICISLAVALLISSGIAHTINQAVNAIATSSTQIAATVVQQERTTAHQATAVNQTTTTMTELGASSRHAAEQAELSVENARQVLSLAESSVVGANQVLVLAEGGSKSVEKTVEGISELKDTVEDIAEQIMRLSQQTDQIGKITTLVTELANQTNMLALNAAVEAVRAGEYGKGFSIVAGEIRKLADQSKQSAENIKNIITDIQTSISLTVMVTDEGKKNAQQGIKLSQETAIAFTQVNEAINQIILSNQKKSLEAINSVVLSSQQISLNAKQQAVAIQQVVEAMDTINKGATETASGISQTKIGTQKLNEAALELKAVI